MPVKAFKIFSTTADMGFIAQAENLQKLFENSALALFKISCNPDEISSKISVPVQISGGDWPELMVNWLSEILYQHEVKNLLFNKAKIEYIEPYNLKALLFGEPFDKDRHFIDKEVKAITYHRLEIKQTERGIWQVQVIVDI